LVLVRFRWRRSFDSQLVVDVSPLSEVSRHPTFSLLLLGSPLFFLGALATLFTTAAFGTRCFHSQPPRDAGVHASFFCEGASTSGVKFKSSRKFTWGRRRAGPVASPSSPLPSPFEWLPPWEGNLTAFRAGAVSIRPVGHFPAIPSGYLSRADMVQTEIFAGGVFPMFFDSVPSSPSIRFLFPVLCHGLFAASLQRACFPNPFF